MESWPDTVRNLTTYIIFTSCDFKELHAIYGRSADLWRQLKAVFFWVRGYINCTQLIVLIVKRLEAASQTFCRFSFLKVFYSSVFFLLFILAPLRISLLPPLYVSHELVAFYFSLSLIVSFVNFRDVHELKSFEERWDMQVIYRNRKCLGLDNIDDKCVVRWVSRASNTKIDCFQYRELSRPSVSRPGLFSILVYFIFNTGLFSRLV